MRKKKPHLASLDEVRITREGEYAVVEYLDSKVGTTHLKIGPGVQAMTDGEILELHNQVIEAKQQMAAEYQHIAVEIPVGHPEVDPENWTIC